MISEAIGGINAPRQELELARDNSFRHRMAGQSPAFLQKQRGQSIVDDLECDA
jgi:hypothetical protein